MKNEINRFGEVIRRRWFVVLSVCLIGFALMPIVAPSLPAYTAHAELLIVSEALKDSTATDPNLPSIIASTEVMTRVVKKLQLPMDPVTLSKKVKTKLPPKSSILDIVYKDSDGARAAEIANAVADESVSYYHEIATRGYSDVVKSLNSEIESTRKEVASADGALQRATAHDAFASSDNALTDLVTQYDLLRAQKDSTESTLAADIAAESALERAQQTDAPIARGEILQKDLVYQQVQTEIARDQADLVSERASFRDSFPGLAALSKRTASEQQQLKAVVASAVTNGAGLSPTMTQATIDRQKAESLVASDRARLEEINSQLVSEKSHLGEVAGASGEVGSIRASRDANVQQYLGLVQRLTAAQGDAAQAASLGTLLVVSRAVPGHSSLPIYLMMIAFIIVIMAIAAAFLADAINPRLWGVREIEAAYRRPVFAEVGR